MDFGDLKYEVNLGEFDEADGKGRKHYGDSTGGGRQPGHAKNAAASAGSGLAASTDCLGRNRGAGNVSQTAAQRRAARFEAPGTLGQGVVPRVQGHRGIGAHRGAERERGGGGQTATPGVGRGLLRYQALYPPSPPRP